MTFLTSFIGSYCIDIYIYVLYFLVYSVRIYFWWTLDFFQPQTWLFFDHQRNAPWKIAQVDDWIQMASSWGRETKIWELASMSSPMDVVRWRKNTWLRSTWFGLTTMKSSCHNTPPFYAFDDMFTSTKMTTGKFGGSRGPSRWKNIFHTNGSRFCVVAVFLGIEILFGDGLLAWSTVFLNHQPSIAWMPCASTSPAFSFSMICMY